MLPGEYLLLTFAAFTIFCRFGISLNATTATTTCAIVAQSRRLCLFGSPPCNALPSPTLMLEFNRALFERRRSISPFLIC